MFLRYQARNNSKIKNTIEPYEVLINIDITEIFSKSIAFGNVDHVTIFSKTFK